MREIAEMPWLHVFASPACNLNCAYCSQMNVRTSRVQGNLLQEREFLDFLAQIPPTHMYLSGGEPLIHAGLAEFIRHAGSRGHKISLDTNIAVPLIKLESLLSQCESTFFGFINISHHIVCNISREYIGARVQLLKEYGLPHFVKYVGVPELFPQIAYNMKFWRDQGVGAAVTILQGEWQGRILPEQYRPEEIKQLLELVTLRTHGLQVFNGIRSQGQFCRGGNDFLAFNMHGDKQFISCCHGAVYPLKLEETFFGTGRREMKKCSIETCLGDLMFIYGINGVTDEISTFEGICKGQFDFVGLNPILEFVEELMARGHQLAFPENLVKIHQPRPVPAVSSACGNSQDRGESLRQAPPVQEQRSPAVGETSQRMTAAIEGILRQWQTPEEVVAANPDMAGDLHAEQERLGLREERLTRALAKKVAQKHFALPAKCNFEVISTCVLRCEFCVLSDLKKYRRKTRMTFEDFLKIWQYMELFTTEVEFTGGEPLLNRDVFAMIKEVNRTGVYSVLTTNAQLLNEKRCRAVLEAQPAKILIAYDSVEAEHYEQARVHGSFTVLRDNIQRLVALKRELGVQRPEINLQMVVSKKNVQEIDRFWQEAIELGVDSASIKPVLVWPGSSPEHEKKMIEEYLMPGHPMSYHQVDDRGQLVKPRLPGFCSNTEMVHIGSGSEVIPCWYILKDTYVAGYAADQSFLDIWCCEEYRDYRRRMKDETVNEACVGCIGKPDASLFITLDRETIKKQFPQMVSKPGPQESTAITEQSIYPQVKGGNGRGTPVHQALNSHQVPLVSVHDLHKKLGISTPLDYPAASREKSWRQWKMEEDDAPIFRYLFRHFRPRRHLEFGTWQGAGVLYCLEECDATVWTINLLEGESRANGENAYANAYQDPEVTAWATKLGLSPQNFYRTDSLGFIGRFYLEKGLGHRVCQIYSDSQTWDIANYPEGFFDSVLIDGGHFKEIVQNDTQKALSLVRSGGLVLWHDFCPAVYGEFDCVTGVMDALWEQWAHLVAATSQLWWIYPSWILLGVKR